MKKLFAILLCAAMVLGLAACGGSDTPASSGTPAESGAPNDSAASTQAPQVDPGKLPEALDEATLRALPANDPADFAVEEAGDGVEISDYLGSSPVVVIPETIDGKTVTGIWPYLFANKSTVTAVYIPATVKELNDTFVSNQFLEIVVCEGLETCGKETFFNCPKLRTLILGDKLTTIGNQGVSMLPELEELYIPASMTNIDPADAWTIGYQCGKLCFVVEAGSYMEQFAQENGLNYRTR